MKVISMGFRFSVLVLPLCLVACATTVPEDARVDMAATACEVPRPQICTMDYRPVCANLADGSVKTYANGCGACADVSVASWVEGACTE